MESRKNLWWLGLALVVLLTSFGCSGVLQEQRYSDGQSERLSVSGGGSWKSWDRNSTKEDASALILKKESTF